MLSWDAPSLQPVNEAVTRFDNGSTKYGIHSYIIKAYYSRSDSSKAKSAIVTNLTTADLAVLFPSFANNFGNVTLEVIESIIPAFRRVLLLSLCVQGVRHARD